jgi:exosortase A-associated hydrolase 2
MKQTPAGIPAEPFFLKTGSGQRFCLYHPPFPGKEHIGSFIYVHPFAEELNRSRRMAALQARAFAALGFGVLQIDLLGCGDSSGDFGDARWSRWKDDLATAWNWLQKRDSVPIGLWGLRLGALLALDFSKESRSAVNTLVLWQPVINGEVFLTQFLRMRMASEMLLGSDHKLLGTQEMRRMLAGGETIEVAGYELAPALAASIDTLSLADLAVLDTAIHWFEIVPEPEHPLPSPAVRVMDSWQQQGVKFQTHPVPGSPFWASQEITECRSLLSATTEIFT